MQQIWQMIQPKLRLRLGNIYDAWFLGIEFLKAEESDDRTLIIFKAPNDYYASYMGENYADVIKEEFSHQSNKENISILFLGDTPSENPQIPMDIPPNP